MGFLLNYKEPLLIILKLIIGGGFLGVIGYAGKKLIGHIQSTGEVKTQRRYDEADKKAQEQAIIEAERIVNSQPGDGNKSWRMRLAERKNNN